MGTKLRRGFFSRDAGLVAKELVGKIIVRTIRGKILRGRIVETEAYFSESDPASWARLGKRKSNIHMWGEPGAILIKNVHMHLMLNFVTGKKGKAQAVLIRALEPLNFEGNSSGPGLLTNSLLINKSFNGKSICELENFFIEDSPRNFEICRSLRFGVKNDLKEPFRFYMKGNKFVSKKR